MYPADGVNAARRIEKAADRPPQKYAWYPAKSSSLQAPHPMRHRVVHPYSGYAARDGHLTKTEPGYHKDHAKP